MVFGLIGAYFLFQLGHHVLPSTWSYFAIEHFDWSPKEIGYSLGAVGVLMVLNQAVLLLFALPKLGTRRAGIVGFSFSIFAYPAMQGIMSGEVPGNEQGALQGGLASVSSLRPASSGSALK